MGKVELYDRFDKFGEGHWSAFHEAACRQVSKLDFKREDRPERNLEERARATLQKIQLGEVSRARPFLEMQNERPQVTSREIPQDVMGFEPEELVTLDRKILFASLKSSLRGSSPGICKCCWKIPTRSIC